MTVACVHDHLDSSLDRLNECHWHIHQMEGNYHVPDGFRYALNSFIRAIADVPAMLNKNLERHEAARRAVKPKLKAMEETALFSILKLRRNFIVHQGMLAVNSHGSAVTLEGSKVKFSFPFKVAPWESSDDAYERFKDMCRNDNLWRGLGPDCDSSPGILRTWAIPQLPNREMLEVAFEAWMLTGNLLSDAVMALGGEPLDLRLTCLHEPERVRLKRYSQADFFKSVDGIDLP